VTWAGFGETVIICNNKKQVTAMKTGQLTVSLIIMLATTLFLSSPPNITSAQTQTQPDFFVGVDVAFDNITATKQLADTLRPYTNLFVIGCTYNISPWNSRG
jgi:hypothetical protein